MPKPISRTVASWSAPKSGAKPKLVIATKPKGQQPQASVIFKFGKRGTIQEVEYVKLSGFRKALNILSGKAMFNYEAAKNYLRALDQLASTKDLSEDQKEALKNIKSELKAHPLSYKISVEHLTTVRAAIESRFPVDVRPPRHPREGQPSKAGKVSQ